MQVTLREDAALKKRILKSERELLDFQAAVKRQMEIAFPLDYLKRSEVSGFFDKRGNLVGGFALVMQGPFRVIESIPENSVHNLERTYQVIDKSKVCEITGVWLSSRVGRKRSSFKFWLSLYLAVMMSKKKYFVYAYSIQKYHLGHIYQNIQPKILFRGLTEQLPGMEKAEFESVEMFTKRHVRFKIFLAPTFMLKRFLVQAIPFKIRKHAPARLRRGRPV